MKVGGHAGNPALAAQALQAAGACGSPGRACGHTKGPPAYVQDYITVFSGLSISMEEQRTFASARE